MFTLAVTTFKKALTIGSLDEITGLAVSVPGNVKLTPVWSFLGQQLGEPINAFEYWNATFVMPEGYKGAPGLTLDFDLKHYVINLII